MLRTFLKPGWALMLIFVVAFSYFAFTVLAPWQLGKDDQIVERNEHIAAAYEAEPQPLNAVVDSAGRITGNEWSRVRLHGHFLPEHEVLLRLRPVGTGPSYQSLVPFRTTDGLTVLVNRGWLPAGEGNAVPEIPPAPAADTTIVGMVRANEPQHHTAPIEQEGYQQVYSIHTEQVGKVAGTELGRDYIQLSEGETGVLNPMPVPQLDRGNHLSYGYQWIAFGVMAPLGLAYFVWSEIRERRRAEAEKAALADAPSTQPSPKPAGSAESGAAATPAEDSSPQVSVAAPRLKESEPAPAAPARRQRSRYGNSKPDHYAKVRKQRRERF